MDGLRFEYWDTLRHERKEIEWVVEGLLPKGAVVLLASRPQAGGTELAVALAASVAMGRDFGGLKVRKGAVLWVEATKSREELEAILKTIPPDYDTDPMRWASDHQPEPKVGAIPLYVAYAAPRFDDRVERSEIESAVKAFQASLVVVNGLTACVSDRSLRNGVRAREMMFELRYMAGEMGATLLLTHHLSRYAGRIRAGDHAELAAGAHIMLSLEAGRDARKRPLLRLEAHGGGSFPGAIHYLRAPEPMVNERANPEDEPMPVGSVFERALGLLTSVPKTAHQVAAEGGLMHGTTQHVLKKLVEAGLAAHGPRKGPRLTYVRAELGSGSKVSFSDERGDTSTAGAVEASSDARGGVEAPGRLRFEQVAP